MTSTPELRLQADRELVQGILGRISGDLGLVIARPIAVSSLEVERRREKAVLPAGVSVSFRLSVRGPLGERGGCLLVPLPEAISLASYLLGAPDAVVQSRRATGTLDEELKAGVREVANLLAGAADAAVREHRKGVAIRGAGCQGVAAGAKPAFAHRPDDELVVGSFQSRIHAFPAADARLMLPCLDELAPG